MYIAGGGNNSAGCADLVALDLAGLGRGGALTWRQVATMSQRSPIASEGLSLTPAERAGALVAFGGYNGKYHNAVQVYRPGACAVLPPSLRVFLKGPSRGSWVPTRASSCLLHSYELFLQSLQPCSVWQWHSTGPMTLGCGWRTCGTRMLFVTGDHDRRTS